MYNAKSEKEYRTAHKEKYKKLWLKSRLKRLYGITPEEYKIIFSLQDGCCAICSRNQSILKKRLSVDHDHATGEIRGLLCDACNRGIGLLKDSIDNLKFAILYLEGKR